jgi:hypothetical protein
MGDEADPLYGCAMPQSAGARMATVHLGIHCMMGAASCPTQSQNQSRLQTLSLRRNPLQSPSLTCNRPRRPSRSHRRSHRRSRCQSRSRKGPIHRVTMDGQRVDTPRTARFAAMICAVPVAHRRKEIQPVGMLHGRMRAAVRALATLSAGLVSHTLRQRVALTLHTAAHFLAGRLSAA